MSSEGSARVEIQCTSQMVLSGETPQFHSSCPVFAWLFLWTKQGLKLEDKPERHHPHRSVPETGRAEMGLGEELTAVCPSLETLVHIKTAAGNRLSFEGHGVSVLTLSTVGDQKVDLDRSMLSDAHSIERGPFLPSPLRHTH